MQSRHCVARRYIKHVEPAVLTLDREPRLERLTLSLRTRESRAILYHRVPHRSHCRNGGIFS